MRKWFATDTGLKIVALALAIVTWFFVRAVTSDQRTVEGVPLEIRVKPGMNVAQTSTHTVNVTVRGTTEDLRLASRNEMFAVVNLSQVDEAGRIEAPINTHAVSHPRRVLVVAVEPTNVVVHLEKSIE